MREAIRKLELEGLVVMVPRKGAYVAGVSMKDIHEVYEVRSALEMLAVTLAAERITDEELNALEQQVLRESEEEAKKDGSDLAPFRGTITTSPSNSNLRIASLTGVRLTPISSAN